jgi:ADP-L-glycero-D-manno-heptose 6-epimerase
MKDIIVVDDLTDGRKMTNLNHCEYRDYYDVDDFLEKFDRWEDISFIFHEGAISATREMNGKLIMQRNYQYSKAILNKAFTHKIPFQYASSGSVYGNIPHNNAAHEGAPLQPQTPYAVSKALFDMEISRLLDSEHFHRMEFNIQGLRYFNVYGRNEDHKSDPSPVTKFKKQAKEKGKIVLFEGSENIYRDFICVDDIVQIKLDLMFSRMRSGIYNLGTGTPTSFSIIAEHIARKENAQIEIIPFPEEYKNAYQYWTCAGISKLHEIGIKPNFTQIHDYIFRQ